jgi:hypothetical protein
VLDAGATPEDIRSALVDVLEHPSYREGAARMAKVIEGYGNGSRAVTELERLVSAG